MPSTPQRRLLRLLVVATLVAIPAATARLLCWGKSCSAGREAPSVKRIPFCSLPEDLRNLISAGYHRDRSGDVFAIASAGEGVEGSVPPGPTGAAAAWPSAESVAATRVPIVLTGERLPQRTLSSAQLADVGPTLANLMHLDWPYPQYRQGKPLRGLTGRHPAHLVVVVAWKGVGSEDLDGSPRATPFLRELIRTGAGTLDGRTGSLPVDSTAALTTAGTGGLPSSHGITGTLLRSEDGGIVEAWSPKAPVSIIAGLGDTLDKSSGGRALIGLAGTQPFDRGLIGGTWFPGPDDDDVRIVPPGRVARAAETLLRNGYGNDATPDLLGVALEGRLAGLDKATERIAATANEAAPGRTVIAALGTGSNAGGLASADASGIAEAADRAAGAPVTQAANSGALFLDQTELARRGISQGRIVTALEDATADGRPLFANVFPAFAISFARYC